MYHCYMGCTINRILVGVVFCCARDFTVPKNHNCGADTRKQLLRTICHSPLKQKQRHD